MVYISILLYQPVPRSGVPESKEEGAAGGRRPAPLRRPGGPGRSSAPGAGAGPTRLRTVPRTAGGAAAVPRTKSNDLMVVIGAPHLADLVPSVSSADPGRLQGERDQ